MKTFKFIGKSRAEALQKKGLAVQVGGGVLWVRRSRWTQRKRGRVEVYTYDPALGGYTRPYRATVTWPEGEG